jgi:DNA-binding transcriptional MerR regulator
MILVSMTKKVALFFTSKHVEAFLGTNRKLLLYWRKIGIISPVNRSPGGHFLYSFADLVAIQTINKLKGAGISVNRIKKLVNELKKSFPHSRLPLSEKSLYVLGREVLVVDKKMDFNPITGQGTFIKNEELKTWVIEKTFKSFNIPYNENKQVKTRIR